MKFEISIIISNVPHALVVYIYTANILCDGKKLHQTQKNGRVKEEETFYGRMDGRNDKMILDEIACKYLSAVSACLNV